jgi:hypothetical protein
MAKKSATKTKPVGGVSADVTARKEGAVDPRAAKASQSQEVTPVNPELQWLRANFDDFDKQLEKFAQLTDEEFGKLQQPIAEEGTKLTDGLLRAVAAKRKHFNEHIAMFWEVKQRLTLAARWRSDLPGNQNRTAETNKKNFAAADWTEYRGKFVVYSLSAADKKLAVFGETIKTERDEGGTKKGSSRSGSSTNAQQSKPANIEALGIKLARDLVRITTVLDPAAAVRALQDVVREAEHLLSMLGKPPEVVGKNIGTNPKKKTAIPGATSSVLAKGKGAA